MKHINVNLFLIALFVAFTFASCIDDGVFADDDTPADLKNGYSLNVLVTLDNMGGGSETRGVIGENPMQDRENYVDQEKFRVLFFDHEYKFLFESKSRWVKKLTDLDHSRWLVSIPVFTYGNEDNWNWPLIRTALTSNKFYVAILANRPEMEWYPGFSFGGLPNEADWYDNTGPHWGPDDTGIKELFDLHHCQYDMIYHGKSNEAGYYDILMKDVKKDERGNTTNTYANQRPKMGATSSWVEWADQDGKNDKNGWGKRPTILPDKEHPIPMYGIQEFDKIENWREGTPFNLSDYIPGDYLNEKYQKKSISLLRSVVKIELRIPRTIITQAYPWGQTTTQVQRPNFVGLCYPNIYARCEPLDIWTPTDKLWDEQHKGNGQCEFDRIRAYEPLSQMNVTNHKQKIQQLLTWFYGVWVDHGWDFNSPNSRQQGAEQSAQYDMLTYYNNNHNQYGSSPRIFNPCVQRNTIVYCDDNGDLSRDTQVRNVETYSDNEYYHYVAYVGERNYIDPSDFANISDTKGGKPTVMYWIFNIGSKVYGIPITDYSVSGNPALDVVPNSKPYTYPEYIEANNYMNGINGTWYRDPRTGQPTEDKALQVDANKVVQDFSYTTAPVGAKGYQQLMMSTTLAPERRAWPLIRNHVYTITLRGRANLGNRPTESRGVTDDGLFDIEINDNHSTSIKFE